MTKEEIREVVKETVQEIKKQGLLNACDDANYREVSEILKKHYQTEMSERDQSVEYALRSIQYDPYFRIIRMYYEDGETIENIAEIMKIDVSTVVRNKKKLCLKIYDEIN